MATNFRRHFFYPNNPNSTRFPTFATSLKTPIMLPKSKIYIMGFATLLAFPAIGITLIGFVEEHPWEFSINWNSPLAIGYQTLIGLAFGTLAGLFAWWLINRRDMLQIKMKYGKLIHSFKLTKWEMIFLSFCAGVGEEFLFRGVIQSYWGVWITAIFFVAIHGYLDPRDKKMMTYGFTMTVIIGVLGYMKMYFGLVAPMAAHMAIDVVLLYNLSIDKSFNFIPSQPTEAFRNLDHEILDELENEKTETPSIEKKD
ncbi:MAG: membrane protease YdiL (CAAX protease family) [Salibacteraceae bacterium]|jgi:membrane protease YdiL (CAAX protease family)